MDVLHLSCEQEADVTNTSLLKPFVSNLKSHAALSDDDVNAIYDLPLELHRYRSNSFIIREDHSLNDCLILASGYACAMKITSSGSRQIVALYLPGDGLNFQNMALHKLDYSVVALSDVQVLAVSCDDLSKLRENRHFVGRALDIQLIIEASTLREWMLSISRREAFVRLAHLLCELCIRVKIAGLSPQYGDGLPLTQQVMADCIGLTTVHLNRMYRRLEKDGLIKRTGKTLELPRWEDLRTVGDFDSRYLYLNAVDFLQAA